VAAKYYHFYHQLTEEDAKRSRWFAKFDDDSLNDVTGLVDNLDLEFDHTREYYVVTELRKEKQWMEEKVLREMGYERWYAPNNKGLIHEWEGSVMSQAAMLRVVSDPKCKDFFKRRSLIHDGWGDIALACAARIAKIYPAEANFMTVHPKVGDFSLIGKGIYNHIHYLAHDSKYARKFDFARKFLDGNMVPDDLKAKFCNKDYLFGRDDKHLIAIIRFNEDGTVGQINSNNERFWTFDNNVLQLLNSDMDVTSEFTRFDEGFSNFTGEYKLEKGVVHRLREIKFVGQHV
jgi:hypothetical protein